jgi:hypothetical protein
MPKGKPGDDLDRLTAVRSRLEAVLADADTPARDLAACSREYRQVLDAIAQLAPVSGTSTLDEIAARRRKRGA